MEIWKDVKNYEGRYQVSNLGRVKSLARVANNRYGYRVVKERILKQHSSSHGYLMVGLSKEYKTKTIPVHKLVEMSFLNHNPNGYKIVCDHIDNNPLNNNVENLQLITHRENTSKDRKSGSSKFVGVSWDKKSNKWRAQMQINGKAKHLGRFTDELEASEAYQKALSHLKMG